MKAMYFAHPLRQLNPFRAETVLRTADRFRPALQPLQRQHFDVQRMRIVHGDQGTLAAHSIAARAVQSGINIQGSRPRRGRAAPLRTAHR